MDRLVDIDEVIRVISHHHFDDDKNNFDLLIHNLCKEVKKIPTAYSVEKVVAEVKKLDLDGVSMVEDGKYKLVRKNEVISLIQTNGVCNGRHNTCADCYKMNCPLSTEKTFADKWSEQVRKGGVK